MRAFFLQIWWSLLGASGVIAVAQYLHPATFSPKIFVTILSLAFVAVVFALARTQYE